MSTPPDIRLDKWTRVLEIGGGCLNLLWRYKQSFGANPTSEGITPAFGNVNINVKYSEEEHSNINVINDILAFGLGDNNFQQISTSINDLDWFIDDSVFIGCIKKIYSLPHSTLLRLVVKRGFDYRATNFKFLLEDVFIEGDALEYITLTSITPDIVEDAKPALVPTNESITAVWDSWVKLAYDKVSFIYVDGYLEDTDYESDEELGRVKVLSTGNIENGQIISVNYKYQFPGGVFLFLSASPGVIVVEINKILAAPKVSGTKIIPSSDFTFIYPYTAGIPTGFYSKDSCIDCIFGIYILYYKVTESVTGSNPHIETTTTYDYLWIRTYLERGKIKYEELALDFSQPTSSNFTSIYSTTYDLAYNPPELLSSNYSVGSRDGNFLTLENDGVMSFKAVVSFPSCSESDLGDCPNPTRINFDYFNGYYKTNIQYDYSYTDEYGSTWRSLSLYKGGAPIHISPAKFLFRENDSLLFSDMRTEEKEVQSFYNGGEFDHPLVTTTTTIHGVIQSKWYLDFISNRVYTHYKFPEVVYECYDTVVPIIDFHIEDSLCYVELKAWCYEASNLYEAIKVNFLDTTTSSENMSDLAACILQLQQKLANYDDSYEPDYILRGPSGYYWSPSFNMPSGIYSLALAKYELDMLLETSNLVGTVHQSLVSEYNLEETSEQRKNEIKIEIDELFKNFLYDQYDVRFNNFCSMELISKIVARGGIYFIL